jgi:leader peptidase (prepilin peptidase)/N-methyltransferase
LPDADHLAGIAQGTLVLVAPALGSFAGVLGARIPAGLPWVAGRSACPACGHTIAAVDLVPVLGWLAQGGRCRHCRARIDAIYLVADTGPLLVALAAVTALPLSAAVTLTLAVTGVVAIAVAERRHGRVPVVFPGFVGAMGAVAVVMNGADILGHVLGAVALAGGVVLGRGIAALTARRKPAVPTNVAAALTAATAVGLWVPVSALGLPVLFVLASILTARSRPDRLTAHAISLMSGLGILLHFGPG